MDNSQKAIQMVAAIFFFVIAVTTAIFLYTSLMENVEEIIVISDRNRTSSEYVVNEDISYKREVNRDEVLMTILGIENNTSLVDIISVTMSSGYTYEFKKGDVDNNTKMANWWNISGTKKYSSVVTETSTGLTKLTYTQQA